MLAPDESVGKMRGGKVSETSSHGRHAAGRLRDRHEAYDWRTGNNYQWHTNPDGSTRVNDFNTNTGRLWNRPSSRTAISAAWIAGGTSGSTTTPPGTTGTRTARCVPGK